MIQPVCQWLRIGHAQSVDVGESVVPHGAGNVRKGDHACDGLLQGRPRGGEVNAFRLQRHDDSNGGKREKEQNG